MDESYEHARRAQNHRLKHAPRASKAVIDHAWGSALADGSATQREGHRAEQRAAEFLQQRGLRVLAANLRCKIGELDLVAMDGAVLVFVEVRIRQRLDYGSAAASVDYGKQRRIVRSAQFFLPGLARRHCAGRIPACRFDILAIDGAELSWLRDAFRLESSAGARLMR